MKSNPVSAQEEDFIKECLQYDAEKGIVSWRVDAGRGASRRHPGDIAGCRLSEGYIQIKVHGRKYLAHRIAWFLHYGEWTENEVDHINGSKIDNRILNLRNATRAQNKQNERLRDCNTSGYKGVSFCKNRMKWRGGVMINGKKFDLGFFTEVHDAGMATEKLRDKLHGEFSRSI